ncbi:hypothetical protein [Nocardioides sp.]|uniref:hypothetical protein n=1 Tax=Nocardioides sp. TaxID=35761 RepID=UPI00321ABB20
MTSIAEAYRLARTAGLTDFEAITAVAIAISESGLNPNAEGDTTIQTSVWGPSIGLWQIRSLKADYGTGRTRDASRLKDPAFNARSMFEISNGGTYWGPWSVYTSGAYKANLNKVSAATNGPISSNTAYDDPTAPGSIYDPGVTPGGGEGGNLYPGDVGKAGDGGLFGLSFGGASLSDTITKVLVVAAAVGLGVSLVSIGAWRVVS